MKRCSPAAKKLLYFTFFYCFFLPFVSKVQLFQKLLHESLKSTRTQHLKYKTHSSDRTLRYTITIISEQTEQKVTITVIVTFCSVCSELIVILLFIPYNHIFQEEEYVNDS